MTAVTKSAVIESPCVRICALDPTSDVCVGCGRTLAEITRWYGMSSDERSRIMAALPQRIETLRVRAKALSVKVESGFPSESATNQRSLESFTFPRKRERL
jgi:uncharacterized protein